MNRPFEIIDITADIGIVAHARTLKDTFANAALALFSLITRPEEVKERTSCQVRVTAGDREALLVRWLNELIYLFDTEHLLFSRFDIRRLGRGTLSATCYGEKADPTRHQLRMGVKAATYHQIQIAKNRDGYAARVIFDV